MVIIRDNNYEQEDELNDDDSSIGSVDLTNHLQDNDSTTTDSNASVTSMMPYGRIAAAPRGIQEVVLRNHQTEAHLLESGNIELRGDNHNNKTCLTMDDAAIICRRLKSDPTLISLRFDECSASCPAIAMVIQAVGDSKTLQEVRFDDCSALIEQPDVRDALQRNTSLHELSLYFMGANELADMLEIVLSNKKNLTSLVMFECEMAVDWEHRLARGLCQNTSLTVLRIVTPIILLEKSAANSSSSSTVSTASSTAETPAILIRTYEEEQEDLVRRENATRDLLESVCQLPFLKILVLSGFDFGETLQRSIGPLLSNLRHLERLSLRCSGISTIGCTSLAKSLLFNQQQPQLQRLDLSRNCCIGDEGIMALLLQSGGGAPCCRNNGIKNNNDTKTMSSMSCSLQELELNYVGFTDRGMEALAVALPTTLSSLKTLSLIESTPSCQHTRRGIRHLLGGLSRNYSLTTLSVWPDTNENKTLRFYLRANRAGRGTLLRRGMELPTPLWPMILEKTQRLYGSDVLFSFLRESQSLFVHSRDIEDIGAP